MKVVKKIWEDRALLTLTGEFDPFVCRPFLEQIDLLLQEGIYFLVLNMEQVTFINSTAIGGLLKARRKAREAGGEMLLSSPSPFVQETLDQLGLSDLIRRFPNDEQALESFAVPEDGVRLSDESNNVLVHLPDKTAGPVIGRMRTLDRDRLVFEVPKTRADLASGLALQLKFRLPLYARSRYFEIPSTIEKIVHSSQGALVTASFNAVSEEDREALDQFVEDMQFLRKEARG